MRREAIPEIPTRAAVDIHVARAMTFEACVVTLALDSASQGSLDAWRERLFPSERNFVPAHVSLFHALPGGEAGRWLGALEDYARTTTVFPVDFKRAVSSGSWSGVAVESVLLARLQASLQEELRGLLTRQDAQPYRPHVTIINKLERDAAAARHAVFAREFSPWMGEAIGLDAWGYAGGPWEHLHLLPFLPKR